MSLKSYTFLIVTAALIITAAYFVYQPYAANWDEHVYFHESQYLQTDGERGFLETLRPLGLPVLLSLIGFTTLEATRLASIAIGAAMLLAFYQALIALGASESDAVVTTLLVALIPLLLDAIIGVRAMPLAFLAAALSVIAYARQHWAWMILAGALATYAFHTRAVYGAWIAVGLFIPIVKSFTDSWNSAEHITNFAGYAAGVATTFTGFGILHYQLFSSTAVEAGYPAVASAAYPVIQQFIDHATRYVWVNAAGPTFYLAVLFGITPMFAAAPLILDRLGDGLSAEQWYVALSTLTITAFLFITPHKEPRYLLAVIPWFLAAGYQALVRFVNTGFAPTRSMAATVTAVLFLSTMVPGIADTMPDQSAWHKNESERQAQYNPLPFDESDEVLLGTPVVRSNASLVIGYQTDQGFFDKLNADDYDGVVYDEDAFPCQVNDSDCYTLRNNTKEYLADNYNAVLTANTTTVYASDAALSNASTSSQS